MLSSFNSRLAQIEDMQEVTKPVVMQNINLSAVGKSSQLGRRTSNEDRIIAMELRPDLLMFGILDGHGGSAAADYVKVRFSFNPSNIKPCTTT